jgi:hypothetical protein
VNRNQLSDSAAVPLAALIRSRSSGPSLLIFIQDNLIGNAGLQQLASAVEDNESGLFDVKLRRNRTDRMPASFCSTRVVGCFTLSGPFVVSRMDGEVKYEQRRSSLTEFPTDIPSDCTIINRT